MFSGRSDSHQDPATSALEVVIAGGGVAALETALALHELAADRVRLTLLTPARDFVYRPLSVLEPFVDKPARNLPLADVATELNATLEQDTLASVDHEQRVLRTGGQRELPYDALVIAVGARTSPSLPDAIVLDPARMDASFHTLIEEIDQGSIGSLAFVAPRPTWPLPVYELALLAKKRAQAKRVDLDVTIITAEEQPLAVFGAGVSTAVTGLLRDAGIGLIVDARAESSTTGELMLHPSERRLRFDRVVALPRLLGPSITGLPADVDGFLPVTSDCVVAGTENTWAAGDATDFPVKFGAIAAQQADAAASSIAALAGASVEPEPFDGIVHGMLLSGEDYQRLYFSARIEGGIGHDSRISDTPTHSPEAKIAARYLGPYLDRLWADGPRWVSSQLALETLIASIEEHASQPERRV